MTEASTGADQSSSWRWLRRHTWIKFVHPYEVSVLAVAGFFDSCHISEAEMPTMASSVFLCLSVFDFVVLVLI
jgi:hypothetical protein